MFARNGYWSGEEENYQATALQADLSSIYMETHTLMHLAQNRATLSLPFFPLGYNLAPTKFDDNTQYQTALWPPTLDSSFESRYLEIQPTVNDFTHYAQDTRYLPAPTFPSNSPSAPLTNLTLSSNPTNAKSQKPFLKVSLAQNSQCFDHGCNGRQFSTYSNLLRHQREKGGKKAGACPSCKAKFTRTTAMNSHIQEGKCQDRRRVNKGRPK